MLNFRYKTMILLYYNIIVISYYYGDISGYYTTCIYLFIYYWFFCLSEPPESPQHVEVMEVGSRWLSVRWSPPPGHTTTTQYLVQFQSEMSTTWNNITVNGNTHSAHLSALTPSTVYHLRLLAINDVGSGDPSPIIRAVTLQEGNKFLNCVVALK